MSAFRSAAEEEFSAIFREYSPRLVKWLYWKLPSHLPHVAEDYSQEAFNDLWEILQKGRPVDYPWALLKKIAQRRMADYFARKVNAATDVIDFDDPASVVIEASTGHRYASGDPELALLAGALYTAMERMQEASSTWRSLHALTAKMRPLGEPYPAGPKDPYRSQRLGAARDQAHRDRDDALRELRAACEEVGSLRAELERLGGRDWKSCTGWPPPAYGGGGTRSRKTAICDPDVTECPQGHLLHLDSVGFLEDGTRVCRACSTSAGRRSRGKATAGATS